MADKKQETIEDVVRKIRNEIAELRKVSPNVRSIAADWWEARADEIEAAHKREIEATAAKCCQLGRLAGYGASEIKHQQESVGNAAKLREALMYAEQVLDTAARNVRGETGMVINSAYSEAARKCRAALAAPPRNCDNYATDDKAIAFFADEALLEEWEALKLGKDRDMLATELFSFIRWLFATATEQEGGNNANK